MSELKDALEASDRRALEGLLYRFSPVDVAIAMRELDEGERDAVFAALEVADAAGVLQEVDDETQAELQQTVDETELTQIIEAMPPDERADAVALLDDQQADRVLELMPDEKSDELEELRQHDPDSAGGVMTPEFVAVPEGVTAGDALKVLQAGVVNRETLSYVYAVDDQDRLVGVVDLRELVTADPAAPLKSFHVTPVVQVTPGVDQEQVAQLCKTYELLALPVVDDDGRLLGTVTVDDVMEIMDDEATEDISMMAGTDARELMRKSALRVAQIRLPWILVCLLGSGFSAFIIRAFEVTLKEAIVLVAFIPIIVATGGNSGLQSATITVRGLALGIVQSWGVRTLLMREVLTAVIIGVVCGATLGTLGGLWAQQTVIGWIVGLSLCAAILVATTLGAVTPVVLDRLRVDPAVASGPFITTANDALGLMIYFTIASALLRTAG
ncbi:MAG: magnesium transporter [Armatimonadota bacterium]